MPALIATLGSGSSGQGRAHGIVLMRKGILE
jgi:hypothetical protein